MCKHWDRVGLFKRGRGDKVKTFISLYIYPKTGRRSAKFVSMTELCSAHNAHNPVKFHVSRIYVGVGARICDFLKISEDKNGGLQCCKTTENIDSVLLQYLGKRCKSGACGWWDFNVLNRGWGHRPKHESNFAHFLQWANVKIPEWELPNSKR